MEISGILGWVGFEGNFNKFVAVIKPSSPNFRLLMGVLAIKHSCLANTICDFLIIEKSFLHLKFDLRGDFLNLEFDLIIT